MGDKTTALKNLETAMAADESLPLRESNLVFGEGDPNAVVMFIGEGPGFHEDRLRRPFVGRGGQLLREQIRAIGWKEENVYITNIIKRRPPDNRDPFPEEIEAYKPYLTRQIGIMRPKVIVALGRFAMNYFLPKAKITRDQGKVFRLEDGTLIVPVFHPAAALRGTTAMEAFKNSMKTLPDIVSGNIKNITMAQKQEESPSPEEHQNSLFS